MKTIASLVGVFFAVIIFGAILGFCVTLLFIYSTNFVVGKGSEVISITQYLSLLFIWAGAATIGTGLFSIAYTIRYPQNGLARIVTHTILSILSWLIIIPLCLVGANKFEEIDIYNKKEITLTPNFFRPDDGNLYYYSSVNDATKTATGVSFKLHDINSTTDGSVLLENAPLFQSDIQPFSDILIYDTLSISRFIDTVLPALYYNNKKAMEAFSEGLISWLAFASWGLALYAVIGLRRLFQWRLLNFCVAVLAYLGICIINLSYTLGWDGNIFNLITLPNWMINCIIAAILSCLGILLSIFRPDPNMEHVE